MVLSGQEDAGGATQTLKFVSPFATFCTLPNCHVAGVPALGNSTREPADHFKSTQKKLIPFFLVDFIGALAPMQLVSNELFLKMFDARMSSLKSVRLLKSRVMNPRMEDHE